MDRSRFEESSRGRVASTRPRSRGSVAGVVALGGALLALLGPAPDTTKAIADPTIDFRLEEQRAVDLGGAEPLTLSPDGRSLAVLREGADTLEICSYDVVTLDPDVCADYPSTSIDAGTAVWSPDSTRLAFTENKVYLNHESDLWVFDAEVGTLTDLTDDGEFGGSVGGEAPFDLAPAWSPDGRELAFARNQAPYSGPWTSAIYRIGAAGGEPRRVATVVESEPGSLEDRRGHRGPLASGRRDDRLCGRDARGGNHRNRHLGRRHRRRHATADH